MTMAMTTCARLLPRLGHQSKQLLLRNWQCSCVAGRLVSTDNFENASRRSVQNSFPIPTGKSHLFSTENGQYMRTTPVVFSFRSYSKKGKDKGKKGAKKVFLNSEQLEGLLDSEKLHEEMDQTIDELKEKFIHQITVRTSQGVFDNLMVKTPDGNFPLIQLGQVVQKSAQMIAINMAAAPQYIVHVKTALADSGLNVNPQQDGTSLFVPLPKVTREHRESLAKNAKTVSEKSKKHLRDLYTKYSKKIKASKEHHSSDDVKAADDMVKDLMHVKIHEVEAMTAAKQKELLGGK